MKKKILVIMLMLVAIVGLVAGCNSYHGQAKDPLVAKVRYFDGSMDTIYITNWGTNGAAIWFTSIDGVTTTTGANNVIIIRGDKGE